jgi:hypothetical protein
MVPMENGQHGLQEASLAAIEIVTVKIKRPAHLVDAPAGIQDSV